LGGNLIMGRILHTAWGRRWGYYGAVSALGLVLLGAGQPPSSAPPPSQPSGPRPMDTAAPATPAPQAQASPMDAPVGLIHEAEKAYENVRDYTCLCIKRERINGVLPPADTVMEMKVRTQPFSVYLRWLQPRNEAGQEVCYVAGRNNGMMRVHPKGVLGSFAG